MSVGIEIAPEAALITIKRRLTVSSGEAALRENIGRHYENLEKLAGTLRALGMDDREVDHNLMQVFHTYEKELTNYINRI